MGRLQSSSPLFHPGPPAEVGNTDFEVLKFLETRVEGEILDMGGGRGAYAHALRDLGHPVTLAEKDPLCIEEVQKSGLAVVDMNAVSWSDLQGRFDTVMLIEVLEHVENPREFLINALACAGKKLLLTVPCNDEFQKLFSVGLTYNHIAVTDHLHQFTSVEMEGLFKDLGCPYRLHTGSHLFPHPILHLLSEEMRGFKGKLALSSLKIFRKLGWLPSLFPSRIFVEAYLPISQK